VNRLRHFSQMHPRDVTADILASMSLRARLASHAEAFPVRPSADQCVEGCGGPAVAFGRCSPCHEATSGEQS
jgi:hypothetical protein